MSFLIIHEDSRLELVEREADTLTQLQRIVGGLIDFIPLSDSSDLVINEEFLYTDLKPNWGATVLLWLTHDLWFASGTILYGPTVLVAADKEGNTTDASEAVIDVIFENFKQPRPTTDEVE